MRIRTWLEIALLLMAACGAGSRGRKAQGARYDGTFETVFADTAAAVRASYPQGLELRQRERAIKTAWHAVEIRDASTSRARDQQGRGVTPGVDVHHDYGGDHRGLEVVHERQAERAGGDVAEQDRLSHLGFVRFDVQISGGPPWRVEVTGFASRVEAATGRVTPIPAADTPSWLAHRQRRLEADIADRLAGRRVDE